MKGFEELTLELTDWCPVECRHCSSTSSPTCKNHLSKEIALQLVEEAAHLNAKKISFGGGEPTVTENFMEILTRVVELGMAAEIFTCGLTGGGQNLAGIPAKIIRGCRSLAGVKFIFSFHGASEDVHDYVTQREGSFNVLMRSLESCFNKGIDCEMNFVPTKINFHEFERIVSIAESLGIRRVSILRFVPQGRGERNRQELELSGDQEDLFVESLLRLRGERDIEIRTGSPFNGIIPGNEIPCRAGFGKLVVQANGNVLPCEVFKHHKRCKWNLSVCKQTLTEILDSPQITVLRNTLTESNCMQCPVHRALRNNQKAEVNHALSQSAAHAK